jgi:hypothetical protein
MTSLRLAAASFCILHFLVVEAMAHVRTPDYSHVGRKMEAGSPEPGASTGVERPGASEQETARQRDPCDGLFGADNLSAASFFSAPPPSPLSDVRVSSMPKGAIYQGLLSRLDMSNMTTGILQVAEAVTVDGAACPLYVSVARGNGEQTFWRFAPDDEPEGWFDERGRRMGDSALVQPKPGSRISSPFGPRRYYGRLSGGGFHDGIDFESRVGEPIYAAADGIVEHQGGYFEYGLTVKIRHAAQFTTLYAHMARFASGLAVGRKVRKGELIGYVGMTGRSTGAHLHFSAIANGRFVDPAVYLSSNGNRHLSGQALAAFRKWQQDIRAAIENARGRQPRPLIDDLEWTTRT